MMAATEARIIITATLQGRFREGPALWRLI